MAFETEFEFTLPKGFVDEEGNLHKTGTMRLATVADEILPQTDPRVQQTPAYLVVILLARVVTRIGRVKNVTTKTIEGLFSGDLAYLQDFYQEINETDSAGRRVVCPQCEYEFEVASEALRVS